MKKYSRAVIVMILFLALVRLADRLGLFRAVRLGAERYFLIPVKERLYTVRLVGSPVQFDCQLANQQQLAELQAQVNTLLEENSASRRLLSAPLPKRWGFLPVKVIGLSGEVISIATDEPSQVKLGEVVVAGDQQGIYLGRVSRVSQLVAQLRLPSSLEEKQAVKIWRGPTVVAQGLLVGKGLGQMKLEQILAEEGVEKEDLVMVTVAGQALLVGLVDEVYEKRGEVFKTATVKRLYQPDKLNTVFVVKP